MKLGAFDPSARKARQPDERFGRFLVRREIVPRDVVEATVETQVIFGRRLGTTLLELGHLEEEELEQQLSAFQDVPLPPPDWLTSPAPEALAAVPAALADELGALPLRDDGMLHVVMLDPRDPAGLEAIQRASGRKVTAYVLCERRLRGLLEQHLGLEQRERAIAVEPLEEWRPAVQTRTAGPAASPPQPDLEALGLVPLPSDSELIDRATFEQIHPGGPVAGDIESEASRPPGAPRPVPVAASLAALEAALAGAAEREHAVETALLVARRHADAAALFALDANTIKAVGVSSPDRREAARDISVPASAECLLSAAAASGQPYRGELPQLGIDALIFHALGRQRAREVLILPVCIDSRVVNLLCVDAGAEPFPRTSEAALEVLCQLLGQTYERLIREKTRLYREGPRPAGE